MLNQKSYLEQLGYSRDEIEQRLLNAWKTLFEGPEDERIYFEAGPDMGYMLDTGNIDVRTEGQSYGMMMAVQMNRQDIFDRIWKWTMTYMYMDQGPNAGYFAWSCSPDGSKNSYGPAPDGEEYFAMALFFASHRWGDRESPFNYSQQARELLSHCIHKGEREAGDPMWDPENYLIKFIPNCDFTDPSYHLPHFYELFARWANPEDRLFWQKAAEASREFLPRACHPLTGLAPEYSYYDGKPNFYNDHGDFYSDSYRVAANLGLDALWFGPRSYQKEIIDAIHRFFADKKPEDYRWYKIDGTPRPEPALHPVGLLATNAMGALATEGPLAENMVRLFWNTPLRKGDRRYYDNCLYFFAMLALSGNYKIY
ncbi:MAG TPA: glycosyl hydrolase family 8 [Treponema sp.]|jgi:oligosaccharide reducing-end xylanase|nr:glycosyl hydrolase family 8 [Treponema sp.]HRS04265.1 glycosyl hydrolase family 8 [Treponema sp.]